MGKFELVPTNIIITNLIFFQLRGQPNKAYFLHESIQLYKRNCFAILVCHYYRRVQLQISYNYVFLDMLL